MSWFYVFHLKGEVVEDIAIQIGVYDPDDIMVTTLDVLTFIRLRTRCDIQTSADVKGRFVLSFHEDDDKKGSVNSRNTPETIDSVARLLGIDHATRYYRNYMILGMEDEDEYSDLEEYKKPVPSRLDSDEESLNEDNLVSGGGEELEVSVSKIEIARTAPHPS